MKIKNFQSIFNSMIDVFSSSKDANAQWDKDSHTDTIMEISVAQDNHLLFTVWISTHHKNSILV